MLIQKHFVKEIEIRYNDLFLTNLNYNLNVLMIFTWIRIIANSCVLISVSSFICFLRRLQ